MTLKEKFSIINCNDCDMPYCEIKCTILTASELNHLEKIADELTIAFHQWMRINDTKENAEKYFHYTDNDMLNAFKEEQGL